MVAKHRLRLVEVPVPMRERAAGRSSIGALRSIYYMVKVLLALFVGAVPPQRRAPGGGDDDPAHRLDRRAVASVLLVLVVLELIRRRRLRERYALLWLLDRRRPARALALARRAEHDRRLGRRSRLPAGGALRGRRALHPAVLLHYSTVISKLADQNTVLAQRLALLEQRLATRE